MKKESGRIIYSPSDLIRYLVSPFGLWLHRYDLENPGAITPDQRKQIISSSVLAGHYDNAVDRESAYEKLQARAGDKAQTADAPPVAASAAAPEEGKGSLLTEALGTVTAAFQPTIGPRGAIHDSFATSMTKSAMRAASSQIGRQLVRGILGGILGGSTRRR